MKIRNVTLFLGSNNWELVVEQASYLVQDGGSWTIQEIKALAQQIKQAVSQCAPKAKRIAILIDESLCLTALFQMDSPRQARKREALQYKIEEYVPVAAEDLIADFVREGTSVFAVATAKSQILPLIEALGEQGLEIELVAPYVALGCEALNNSMRATGRAGVVWLEPSGAGDFLVLNSGRLIKWATLESPQDLIRQIRFDSLAAIKLDSITCYATEETLEKFDLRSIGNLNIELSQYEKDQLRNLAMETLQSIRKGRLLPRLDLSRGMNCKLAQQSPLKADFRLTQLAIFIFLVSVVVANLVQTHRSQRLVEELASAQDNVWREIFPDTRLPRGVLPRLESELNKLVGVRSGPDSTEAVANDSVLHLVCRCFQALPAQMRFRVNELEIDGRSLDLSGEVRDFEDADQIASAIRSAGFQVKPPTTRRLPDKGVGLRIQAIYSTPTTEGLTADVR